MFNSLNSARVFFSLFIACLFLSACNRSNNIPTKNQTVKLNVKSQFKPDSTQDKNAYLIDCQKNNIKKSSTKEIKDSTDGLELAIKEQSSPIMTFVQYSY